MAIPMPGRPYSYLDMIGGHSCERRSVAGRDITFFVEKTREGSGHPCSIDDVAHLLELVPASDWAGIDTIVFRCPTRKQTTLDPAWGRLRYYSEVLTSGQRLVAKGPMILLDAIDTDYSVEWSSSLTPEGQMELDRMRADGHLIERVGGRYVIRVTPHSARNTQLYRTMLHEIGHWFDWLEKVETPSARSEDVTMLTDRYFERPSAEREIFAHRYADMMREQLTNTGAIPFGSG